MLPFFISFPNAYVLSVFLFRYGVIPALGKGIAAQNTPQCKQSALQCAEPLYRDQAVFGAGRDILAAPHGAFGSHFFVQPNQCQENIFRRKPRHAFSEEVCFPLFCGAETSTPSSSSALASSVITVLQFTKGVFPRDTSTRS